MSTNFYWIAREPKKCEACGHVDEADRLHIGKSSAGWCFSLHVIPEQGINGMSDWCERFARSGSYIEDEYGDRVSPSAMLDKITKRSHPSGLRRSKIDGQHCIGHGQGTYDLIPGEFS